MSDRAVWACLLVVVCSACAEDPPPVVEAPVAFELCLGEVGAARGCRAALDALVAAEAPNACLIVQAMRGAPQRVAFMWRDERLYNIDDATYRLAPDEPAEFVLFLLADGQAAQRCDAFDTQSPCVAPTCVLKLTEPRTTLAAANGVIDFSADGRCVAEPAEPLRQALAGCDARVCPFWQTPRPDRDGDGVVDDCDLCPDVADREQRDADGDGMGDACADRDGDGVLDAVDLCPAVADPAQGDLDGDEIGDACDEDGDGDGVVDALDLCPWVADDQRDADGDGLGDACDDDDDGDGVPDALDLCPRVADPDQRDADGDGLGDVCDDDDDDDGIADGIDRCPTVADPDQRDSDGDGIGDACDACPLIADPEQAADADPCADRDLDGVRDPVDNCPRVANPEQGDADGDGVGDACDDGDRDGDGIVDGVDVCPYVPDAAQLDSDRDGQGDACDFDVVRGRAVVVCRGDERGPPCNGCAAGTEVPPGWVCVPAGEFVMGTADEGAALADARPAHPVRISRAFLMTETEVTQGAWEGVMGENPAHHPVDGGANVSDHPVESVSWYQAVMYVNALSDTSRLERCYSLHGCTPDASGRPDCEWVDFLGVGCAGYRLSTEAEWEYATRAGSVSAYWSGDEAEDYARVAWYNPNSGLTTRPVGQRPANQWGLFDMHGNVHEWAHDGYQPYPVLDPSLPLVDPIGARGGARRAFRGGSFLGQPTPSAFRSQSNAAGFSAQKGLRPVRTLPVPRR